MADLQPLEQLSLLLNLLVAPMYVMSRVVHLKVLRKDSRGDSWKRIASDALLRYLSGNLSIAQLKSFIPPTRAVFDEHLAKTGTVGSVHDVGEGASLLWLGSQGKRKTLLYFHGGAYLFPLRAAHLNFLAYLRAEHIRITGCNVNVVILEYSLAPEHMFPTQLRQACAAVTHLVDSGTSPSDLFIGGDSVGASLGLALLSHILHPHPELLPLPLARPLAGAFAISPYSTDARGISMHSEDNLHPRSYVQYIAATSTKNSTAWGGTDALGPPSGWWTLLPTVTPRVLVTSGSAESLCGRQLQLVQRLQKEAPDAHVELVLEEGAVHTNPVCDLDAMGDGPGEAAKRIAEWLAGAQ